MNADTVKLPRKCDSDKNLANDLVLVSQQIGCIADSNCHYTAKLTQRIKTTGKTVSGLTIAELIELDNLETRIFNQVNSKFNQNDALMVDLSHRLFLLSYAFSPINASMTINETVNSAISVLTLLEGQFAEGFSSRLNDGTIYFAFHEVKMIIEDIESIVTAFKEVTKPENAKADYVFSTIDKNLSNMRSVISLLCNQFAEDGINHQGNQQISNSIDAVKQDLVNIGSLFSDLCKSIKHQA